MEQQLKTTITADTNGFIQAINAATSAVNNASDNWATRIAVAQNSLTSAAMAASDLRNRLQEAGKETIGSEDHDLLKDQLDETKRAADQALNSISAIFQEISDGASQMGTTAQEFQELQAAASAANVPMEDVADAFEHINTLSRDVANSNEEAKQTFRDLHITQELIQSSSPVEKMRLLQTALEGVADETKKASLANRVFGQSHTQVAALCQGYETAVQNAHQRGAIATQKEIDALRQLQKQAQTSFQTLTDASAAAAEKTKSQWDKFKEAVHSGNLVTVQVLKKAWQGLVDIINLQITKAIEKEKEETEAARRLLDTMQETSKANQEARSEAERNAAALVELASKESLSNEEKIRQAELLIKLGKGYSDLTEKITASSSALKDFKALQEGIQKRNNDRTLKEVESQMAQVRAERDRQREIAEKKGMGWFTGFFAAFGSKLGLKGFDEEIKGREDAVKRLDELNKQYVELMKQYNSLRPKKTDEKRQAKLKELKDRLDSEAKAAARADLKNTINDEQTSRFDRMRREAEEKAQMYAKEMGVGMDDEDVQRFLKMRRDAITAQEKEEQNRKNAGSEQAYKELKRTIDMSGLDTYAQKRKEADDKVEEMRVRLGKKANEQLLKQYKELLYKEIVEKEKAEREKAAAAAAAESKRAAEESRRNAVQAAGERARERAQARKDELQRQIGKFGFSISNPELLDETSSERRARNRQARQDARIQEKLDTLESGKGVVFTDRERERIQQLQDLQKEFDEIDPAQAAAEAQQEAADRLSDAADKLADAAETFVKGGPKNPEITAGLHRDSSKSFIIKKGRDDEEKKGNEKKGEETEGKDDGNKQGGLFGFGSEGERFSLRGARQSAGGIFQGLDYRTMEEKQRELEEQMAIKFPDIPEPSDYSSQIQQVIATLKIMAKHNYIIKG